MSGSPSKFVVPDPSGCRGGAVNFLAEQDPHDEEEDDKDLDQGDDQDDLDQKDGEDDGDSAAYSE